LCGKSFETRISNGSVLVWRMHCAAVCRALLALSLFCESPCMRVHRLHCCVCLLYQCREVLSGYQEELVKALNELLTVIFPAMLLGIIHRQLLVDYVVPATRIF